MHLHLRCLSDNTILCIEVRGVHRVLVLGAAYVVDYEVFGGSQQADARLSRFGLVWLDRLSQNSNQLCLLRSIEFIAKADFCRGTGLTLDYVHYRLSFSEGQPDVRDAVFPGETVLSTPVQCRAADSCRDVFDVSK